MRSILCPENPDTYRILPEAAILVATYIIRYSPLPFLESDLLSYLPHLHPSSSILPAITAQQRPLIQNGWWRP